MKSGFLKFFAILLVALAISVAAFGQDARPAGSSGVSFDPSVFGTVTVYLRTEEGKLLPQRLTPIITIAPASGGVPLRIVPQMLGDGWLFSGVGIGDDYHVTVVANGYTPAQENVHLANTPGVSATVIVLLKPLDQELTFHPPTGDFVLPPAAQKEVQHALEDLQRANVPSAQKHMQKAMQWAPGNPYVQYVMGMTYLLSNQISQAKPYLEKSVSIDSREPRALTALGTVRYKLGDSAGAVDVLSKSVQLDGSSWKAEWLLAASYLGVNKYAEARDHAEQALKIGKDKAGRAELVLGQALAGLGQRSEAAAAFDKFAETYPKDENAHNALDWAKLMRQPATTVAVSLKTSAPGSAGVALPPVEVPPRADWAPPDIDATSPFVISGVTCPLAEVLKAAETNAEQVVATLQEFSATEEYQSAELKPNGEVERANAQAYNYLVFIEQITPKAFQVEEVRYQGKEEAKLPGIADMGAPALALAFHPVVQNDLEWKCEGLGKWNDRPAWVVHFQQRPDRPSVLASFTTPSHDVSLPLKGRAWVSETGGQVMHMETDLVNEIQPIDLKREHFSIEYKLVSFQAHHVDLWLPENVDSYYQYGGHFLHHYHHYTDFKLFWVGASQKIGDPKQKPEDPNQKDPQ